MEQERRGRGDVRCAWSRRPGTGATAEGSRRAVRELELRQFEQLAGEWGGGEARKGDGGRRCGRVWESSCELSRARRASRSTDPRPAE